MSARSTLISLGSLGLGAFLIWLLVMTSGISLGSMYSCLASVKGTTLVQIVLLLALNAYLSSQKWRLVDSVLRAKTDLVPSNFEAFAMTSIGTTLGQILPIQVSMPLVRTFGTWMHGRAIRRGTLGTYFEQLFDLSFVGFMAIPSLGTYFMHGGGLFWLVVALPVALLAIYSGGMVLKTASRVTTGIHARMRSFSWIPNLTPIDEHSPLEPWLGQKLMLLSALRYMVLVIMAQETTAAIHANIPIWHLAVAMPFAVLATAIGITPGGLGITEFTYTGVLHALGTSLAVTSQWALVNRLLIFAAAMIMGVCLAPFFFFARIHASGSTSSVEPLLEAKRAASSDF